MKIFNPSIYAIILAILMTANLTSCNANEELLKSPADDAEVHTCKLIFEGDIQYFDGAQSRGAGWQDGDCIYLTFTEGIELVQGKAIYSAADGYWTLTYNGTLSETKSSTCTAYFFDADFKVNEESSNVVFTPNAEVYGDVAATYTKNGKDVKLTANIAPLTGRIRIKGNVGTTFTLSGFRYYDKFDIPTATLTPNFVKISVTVGEDGYTPYIYGYYPSTNNYLYIDCGDVIYKTVCNSNVLNIGKSGYMEMPTKDNHNGWKMVENKSFTVSGIKFNMKYVAGNSKIKDFYIAETETTQGLWKAVMVNLPSGNDGTSNKPVTNMTYSECLNFIEELNKLTGETFYLPSKTQWLYAASGGNSSVDFIYSGSDVIDNVAWYEANSNNECHIVAIKQPNELGIYDMSGNVTEWTSEYGYEFYGGAYDSFSNNCRKNACNGYSTGSNSKRGFRLSLNL